jgi:hypothetical protein
LFLSKRKIKKTSTNNSKFITLKNIFDIYVILEQKRKKKRKIPFKKFEKTLLNDP